MGERMRWCIARKTARTAAAAGAALGATLLLASCSLPAAVAGAPASPGDVVDPSVTSPAATSTPDATVAVDTPSPEPTEGSVVVTPSPAAAATLAAVTPFITSPSSGAKVSGDLDVSAIVPKVVESGGTCTLVATKGSVQRTDRAKAVAASSYTGCEPMTLTDLSAGTWSITVRYTSDESAGTSAAVRVTAG